MAGLRDTRHGNLPRQLSSFIGRGAEIVRIKRLLASGRLITLTGAGGCGKTRLAQEVGAGLHERFNDGVWWVEMAALSDPRLVPHAVASALGIHELSGRPVAERVVEYLQPKELLLLLDNCEHLRSACAQIADTLLRSCANVRIIATSRQSLGVMGEITWRVPSLSIAPRGPASSAKRVMQYESTRLFCERARAIEPAFTLSDHNAVAVVDVCARLDGIPLAIELAAARVRALTVEQIASRLDDRFRFLTGGGQGVLPRHQTLRAVMEWSHGLLSEHERGLLRRLSVFAGGWTLEAAEAICAGQGVEASSVLDLLMQLVDKSLVMVDTGSGTARYRLLETVRQYGVGKLGESGEAIGVRTRHRDWYLRLAEGAYPDLHESRWRCPDALLAQLRLEHDNFRSALTWSLEDNLEAGLALAGALGPFWSASSQYTEGRAWLTKVLHRTKPMISAARARALRYAGFLAWLQGEYHEAAILGEEGLALARQLDHREHTAGLLYVVGVTYSNVGNYERAAKLLEEGRALFHELGDTEHEADMLRHHGRLAANRGDYPEAVALLEHALNMYREIGAKDRIAYTLQHLSVVRRYQRDYTEAASLAETSLTIFRELGATEGKAHALSGLARVLRLTGNYGRAWRLYAECLALSSALGIKLAIQGCFYGMASVSACQAESERATRLFAAAESVREGIGYAVPAADREEYDATLTTVRSTIGEAAFTAVWAEGRAMTLRQAVEYALASDGPAARKHKRSPGAGAGTRRHAGLLAPREREVATLVALGLTNREIASRLVITERTAETHVQHILNKLGFNSRAQIAAWAVENGLSAGSTG